MYVNPFERMKKKREEEEKKRNEQEKEKEKYARLGVQMGFAEGKAVVPSFIKTLMGGDTNQAKVPPFGMAMDNNFDNLPNPGPLPQSSNRTMESFESQFNSSSFLDSQEFEPTQPNSQIFSEPSTISKTNNNIDNNLSIDNSLNQGPLPFGPSINQEPSQQQGPLPFGPSINQEQAKNINSINENQKNNKDLINQNINIKSDNQNKVDPQLSEKEVLFNVSENLNLLNFDQENIDLASKDLLIQEKYSEFEDFFEITEEEELVKEKIIAINIYDDLLLKNKLKNKSILFVNHEELMNLSSKNTIQINMDKVISYSTPCLYLLKALIKNLPKIFSDEDKKVFWERTSLILAATKWGKTGSEIDILLEELNLTSNPIELFIEEFKNLFNSYSFNEEINIYFLNTPDDRLEDLLFVSEFINKMLMKVSQFSIKLNIKLTNIDLELITFIFKNFDYIVSDENFYITKYEKNKLKNETSKIKEENLLNKQIFDFDIDDLNEDNEVSNNVIQDQFITPQSPPQTHDQFITPQISNVPQEHIESTPKNDSKLNNNLNQFFNEELKDVPNNLFEKPQEIEISQSYDKESKNFTGNIPGMTNNDFNEMAHSSKTPNFLADQYDQEYEDDEEDYDPGIDENLRIHVGQVLEAKKLELLEQEKQEELSRLERKGESWFDPSIISKKEVKLEGHDNFFGKRAEGFKSPLIGKKGAIEDPRPREKIEEKLKDMNQELANRKAINIEDRFANEKNKDKNLISIPGNWDKLK